MKQQILCALFILNGILFNSCTEKEDPAQITISDSSIEYFQNQMDFSADRGSMTIQFSTNKDWEINLSESGMNVDWCTITPSKGMAGEVSVNISVDQNATYDERYVIATLTAGDKSEKLRITQKQNDAILISSTLYEIPMEGGEISFEVKSNIIYEVEIPEQYQGWIQSGTKTRGLESKELQFKIFENLDYEKREGEIIFSNGQIAEVVKIYQSGGGILILSKDNYDVSSEGGYITVDLSSNFEFAYEVPDLDWIRINNGTRGMSSHTLYFEILPNETYDLRSAIIHFYDPKGIVNENVTINQAQKDAIIISHKDFQLDSNENFITVDLNTNIDFYVIIPESSSSWISEVNNPLSRSLNPYNLVFKIEENKTYDERNGEIIISGINTELSDTLTIKQDQNDAIFIDSPKEISISYEGGQVNIDISSNIEVELEFMQDWTHHINSRGLTTSILSFDVDENDTPYERIGTVVVKKWDSDLPADTMYVKQEKGFLTLNVQPGQLESLLEDYPDLTIEKLKLYGSLDTKDYLTLRNINTLWYLDLINISDKTMPKQAFMNVKNIKTIKLPQYLEEIPDELFNMTEGGVFQGLTCELIIPNTVKRIGKNAFSDTALSGKLIIPNSVEEIDAGAFQWVCVTDLIIGNGVKKLGDGCFNGLCFYGTPLSYLYIGNKIEQMGASVFSATNYPYTIVIPDNITSLGYQFFSQGSFTSIVLGSSLSYLGWGSLDNLSNLKSLYCKSKTPPTYDLTIYNSINNTPLLFLGVPIGTKELYKETEPWKNFMVIEEIDYDNFVIPGTE